MAEVAADVAGRAEGVRAVAVSHRIGLLGIGDVALACAVAADHRREAFTTCAELVEEVKRRLPVWKHQAFADGTDEWVNSAEAAVRGSAPRNVGPDDRSAQPQDLTRVDHVGVREPVHRRQRLPATPDVLRGGAAASVSPAFTV